MSGSNGTPSSLCLIHSRDNCASEYIVDAWLKSGKRWKSDEKLGYNRAVTTAAFTNDGGYTAEWSVPSITSMGPAKTFVRDDASCSWRVKAVLDLQLEFNVSRFGRFSATVLHPPSCMSMLQSSMPSSVHHATWVGDRISAKKVKNWAWWVLVQFQNSVVCSICESRVIVRLYSNTPALNSMQASQHSLIPTKPSCEDPSTTNLFESPGKVAWAAVTAYRTSFASAGPARYSCQVQHWLVQHRVGGCRRDSWSLKHLLDMKTQIDVV